MNLFNINKKVILLAFSLLYFHVGFTQETAQDKKMEWWREAKFGMFIHWGVYAQLAGTYEGHQQKTGASEWIMNIMKIPVNKYQPVAKDFNPVKYNADEWVKTAKDAGMKYIVITAKHHDGFAMFKTKASKWNIVDATPYGKDVLTPLAEACKKHGIKLGFYYSHSQDWNNPGGSAAVRTTTRGWNNPDSAAIDKYVSENSGHWDPAQTTRSFADYVDQVAVPQVKELLSNYGEVSVFWWDTPHSMTNEIAQKFQDLLALQPNIITNDRLKKPNFLGDTKTPERKIPSLEELDGKDWETCNTMNTSWGYKSYDHRWKSPEELIENLIDIASKGGNFLLNVGPKADGTFPEESTKRLKQIGEWMKINSEAIYATKANPLNPVEWGRITRKEDSKGNTTLYLSVLKWPKNGIITIPDLKNKLLYAQLLADGTPLKTDITNNGIRINLPAVAPDKVASVIKLQVSGTIKPVHFPAKNDAKTD
ncbi:alpha-L-fucosidase [Pedobacter sp. MW01-1-1]|uniref:alpha-L-fucosidase n=1 Tax=Pedobacter sp. MW01-1-1 TaxID=3383027 RepID=UPI003FEE9045